CGWARSSCARGTTRGGGQKGKGRRDVSQQRSRDPGQLAHDPRPRLSRRLASARAGGRREESAMDDAGLRQRPLSRRASARQRGCPRRDGGLASGSATRTGSAEDLGGAGRRLPATGFKPQTLLTSLHDAEKYPAKELAALYHERWEIELGYDEGKTEMLERREHIRSKKPEGVEQELWGLALAYNLIRLEMLRIAREA